jgi:hypothetical protein
MPEFAMSPMAANVVAAMAVSDFVTPRDLQFSRNLYMVGTLKV